MRKLTYKKIKYPKESDTFGGKKTTTKTITVSQYYEKTLLKDKFCLLYCGLTYMHNKMST